MPILDRDTLPMVAMHLLPLLGVWLLGWDANSLLLLYWLESAVVGLWTVVLIALAPRQNLPMLSSPGSPATTGIPIALFVLLHGGFFMFVHMFILQIAFEVTGGGGLFAIPAEIVRIVLDTGMWVPLAGLFVIRMLVTAQVLHRDEPVQRQLIGFYFRIIVMQFALILGGFLLAFFGANGLLLVLVGIRIACEFCLRGVEDAILVHMEEQTSKAG